MDKQVAEEPLDTSNDPPRANDSDAAQETDPRAQETDPWMRLGFLVIQALAQQAVFCSEEELQTFRGRVDQVTEVLEQQPAPSRVLIAAGSVTQAVENYNSRTQRAFETACA